MKILNAMPPYNLFGLEEQDYGKAKVVALPVPYDSTSTYKIGSREGPRAIIEASRNLELYDEEFGIDVSTIGVYTTEELAPDFSGPKAMVDRIAKETSIILDDGKMPVLLGGEHTIAVGAVKALSKAEKDFSVIHFDAHSDSRDELYGTKYCHACVMSRIREMCDSCVSVGVRSIDERSAKELKDILYMKDILKMDKKQIADMIVKRTRKKIYMTIDLDVLDTGEFPATGTPEPGGMRYNDLKDILSMVLEKKRLLGADFNELCPIPGMAAPNVLAAKLILHTICAAFKP
jgi:agmatinase